VPYTSYEPASGGTVNRNERKTNMAKVNIMRNAVIPGLIALTAFLLSIGIPINEDRADHLVGFGAVLALIGILALEYRISFKWLSGR